MKNHDQNEFVAQGAAAWQEKETHEQIMQALNSVYGHESSYFQINGYVYYWAVETLPAEKAIEIAERGHHDEIMYMIHRYGKANYPAGKYHNYSTVYRAILPEKVQEIIARRNNPEEMDAYLSYQGFDKLGQDVVLGREDHNEIMRYLHRHGFLPAQQRKLKARGNKEEIALHITKHGWANELLDEMFDNLAEGKGLEDYYDFISKHELPVAYQKRMVQTVKTPEFQAYVDRYGLWEDAHEDLVEYRLLDEVRYYLGKHPYLHYKGECKLAQKGRFADKLYYLQHKCGSINSFLWAMLKVRPLDYELLTEAFLKMTFGQFAWKEEEDIRLMKNGTHEQVMERVAAGYMGDRAFAQLFFRNNPKEFEAYLEKVK